MSIKNTISILFLFLFTLICCAQEKWNLDDCISYAIEHNLKLKDFKYIEQSGRETYRQSIRNLLPNVSGESSYTVNFGRSTDPFTNDVVTTDFFQNPFSLQSSVDVFQGFQKVNSIKVSKFLYKATQQETLMQRYLLAFRVMQAFNNIQFFEGLVIVSKEQMVVSQKNYSLVEKKIELGLMAGADLYEAESLLLSDKLNFIQSENQLAEAKLKLFQEMNLDESLKIEIFSEKLKNSELIDSSDFRSNSVYSEATQFLPIIKAQEFRVKAAKKQVAVARGRMYPSLVLFAGIGTGYFETTVDMFNNTVPFREQFRDNTSQFLGLSLSIPISNGWSARSRVKQSKIERSRAENDLEVLKQELFQEIERLVQDYNSLLVEFQQSTKNTEAQRLTFTIAQKRYEKGLINAIELFTAKNLFANSQNVNLQVRLRLEVNKRTLNFYKGLPVFNIN